MSLPDTTLTALIKGQPLPAPVELSTDEKLQIEQIRLLRSINGKLTFFAVLAVVSIVVTLMFGV